MRFPHLAWAVAVLAACSVRSPVVAAERVPLAGAVAVSTHYESSCAVLADGGVACWGRNHSGQLGTGDEVSSTLARPVTGLGGPAIQIAVGDQFACALLADGGVQCWGASWDFQLGHDASGDGRVPADVPGLPADVAGITAGTAHACAWTGGGALYCWGQNRDGQLGRGNASDREMVGPATFASGVTHAAAGSRHTCAVRDGRPWCFGENAFGQLDGTPGAATASPREVTALAGQVLQVAAGDEHACALMADRTVRCWGGNASSQLAAPPESTAQFELALGSGNLIETIDAGDYHTCAASAGGAMTCWGFNAYAMLGTGENSQFDHPAEVSGIGPVQAVSAGKFTTCAISGGVVHCWGDPFRGATGRGFRGFQAEPGAVEHDLGALAAVSVSDAGACLLGEEGGVRCWGTNGHGELAIGSREGMRAPVPSGVPDGTVALEHGNLFCALTQGGAVQCAGRLPGQVPGEGRSATRMEPIAGLESGVAAIASYQRHACALTSGGHVRCFGANADGQLGDGSTAQRIAAVEVVGLPPGVQEVGVAFNHSCARTAGTLYCWGNNSIGQLGDGSGVASSSVPRVVPLPSAPRRIALGANHSCVVDAPGDVYCWGLNNAGQLGDGSSTPRTTPVKVQGLTAPVTDLSVGSGHSCALQVDGRLACWGSNVLGQLAAPLVLTRSLTAIDAAWAPAGIVDVDAGAEVTCAIDAGDGAWCWGQDLVGQLGIGSTPYWRVGPVLQTDPDHVHAGGFERLPGGRDATY